MCTSLLDKIGWAIIGDFLLDQRYLILTVLLKYDIQYVYKKKVCLEQNICIESHFMLHFMTFHNVSVST